jgi:hypothetical protein
LCSKLLVVSVFNFLVCHALWAAETNLTNTPRFRAVEVFVDSGNTPLAAYQLEFTASGNAKMVGIEGGEQPAFKEPPYYDPQAMQQERVILGAFSTAPAEALPKGKTRVATIHLQSNGDETPRYEVQLKAAATAGGRKISAQPSANEKQRNEDEKASGQE